MAQQRRRKDPEKIKAAYLKRGYMYNRQEKYTKAKAAFLRVLDIDADNVDAHHNIGITYLALKAPKTAAFHLEKALALDPDMSAVYYKLGYAYMELKRFEEAKEMCLAALAAEREEEKEKAHYVLGRVYIGLDLFEKALEHFLQAHELGMEHIDLDFYIGNTYAFLQDFDLALEHLQKSLIQSPGVSMVHNSIALVYMRQGNLEEAEKYITDSLFLDSGCDATFEVLEMLEQEQAAQKQEEQKQEEQKQEENS